MSAGARRPSVQRSNRKGAPYICHTRSFSAPIMIPARFCTRAKSLNTDAKTRRVGVATCSSSTRPSCRRCWPTPRRGSARCRGSPTPPHRSGRRAATERPRADRARPGKADRRRGRSAAPDARPALPERSTFFHAAVGGPRDSHGTEAVAEEADRERVLGVRNPLNASAGARL